MRKASGNPWIHVNCEDRVVVSSKTVTEALLGLDLTLSKTQAPLKILDQSMAQADESCASAQTQMTRGARVRRADLLSDIAQRNGASQSDELAQQVRPIWVAVNLAPLVDAVTDRSGVCMH